MPIALAATTCVAGAFALVMLRPPDRGTDDAGGGHGHAAAVAAVHDVFAPLEAFESCLETGTACANETRWVVDQAAMARSDLSNTSVDTAEEHEKTRSLAALDDVQSAAWGSLMCTAIGSDVAPELTQMSRTACGLDGDPLRGAIRRLGPSLEHWRT